MRPSLPFFFAVLFSFWSAACSTSRMPDGDARPGREDFSETARKLARIYADKPAYMSLVADIDSSSGVPRTHVMGPPAYSVGNPIATVTVVFVEDEQGRVRDPRIFESSDPRFNEAALNGTRNMKYYRSQADVRLPRFVFIKLPFHQVAEPERLRNSGRSRESTAAALGVSP